MLKRLLEEIQARIHGSEPMGSVEDMQRRYEAFRRLVQENTAALECIADMQAKASGEFLFDQTYTRQICQRSLEHGRETVSALAELSGRPQQRLEGRLAKISREVEEALASRTTPPSGPDILDLRSIKEASTDLVGGKTLHLAEIQNHLRLPVPDGFAITSPACMAFLRANRLNEPISSIIESLSLTEKEALRAASEKIRGLVSGARWPEAASAKILDAFDDLKRRSGSWRLLVSVRSSAAGEDGDFSFAGQYQTVLNVGREGLLQACADVLASQFSPRAIVYLKARGLAESPGLMAIGVLQMVDAIAGGVLYTRDPQDPSGEILQVWGQWGLGASTVDGAASPDFFALGRGKETELVQCKVATKEKMSLCKESSGLVEATVPGWMREQPCLTKSQLSFLASYGQKLEDYYGKPQDVEWALDSLERIIILQSRPLRLSPSAARATPVVEARRGLVPLLREGVVASRGCAAGEVFLLDSESQLQGVPRGAILVARTASPLLAEAIDRVRAIVTDTGCASSHLATIAREFRIPALFNAKGASSVLRHGSLVTVDAEMGNVYEGRVESLLPTSPSAGSSEILETPLLKKMARAISHIAPLNLTDPRNRNFRPSGCQTLHDVLRFCHESGVQELFLAGGRFSKGTRGALKLTSPMPLDFYFVDLGGGLEAPDGAREVAPGQFRCDPLIPLWRGMTQVPWATGAAAGGASVASLMATALTSGEASRRMAEPNFVIVSRSYVNLSCRFGYHFSRVDSYLCAQPDHNFASLLFHGGAAGAGGRARRIEFLAGVLKASRFSVSSRNDALFARAERDGPEEMSSKLEVLGRLLVAARQIDTLFSDEAGVTSAVSAFLAGDYTLRLAPAPGDGLS